MQKTIRSAILEPALRAVKAQSSTLPAEDSAFKYAFQEYINMLSSWTWLQDIQLVQFPPRRPDTPVGNIDPNYELWTALVPRISDYFDYEPTPKQMATANASVRKLRNRTSTPTLMARPKDQPRGSGNRYRRRYYQTNENCCDDI